MKITLNRQTTQELATLAKRVISASKNGKYTVVENHELLLVIENHYNNYEKVYAKKLFSGKGKEVAQADKKRDKLFSNLKKFLNGYRGIDVLPNAKSAEELYQIVERYGLDIDRLNYAEESAQMNKLIEELSSADNIEKITALNLAGFFEQLKTAQQQFESLYLEQIEANADLRKLPSATQIRKGLEQSLRNYFSLLSAMKNVSGWKEIYFEINEIVKGVAAGKSKTAASGREGEKPDNN